MNKQLIKSFVWHDSNCYFVSTITRDSSSSYGPERFNETLVWAYDWEKDERKELLLVEGDCEGSISVHQSVCQRLLIGTYEFQTGHSAARE